MRHLYGTACLVLAAAGFAAADLTAHDSTSGHILVCTFIFGALALMLAAVWDA